MSLIFRISVFAVLLLSATPLYADDLAPWSYDGDKDGQDTWGTLSKAYAKCEVGKEQSPIIIAETQEADLPTLNFRYSYTAAHGRNTGRGAVVSFNPGQDLIYNNKVYHLKHLLVHTPAEHIAGGHAHAAEFQFMHESDDKKLLIVAVFGDKGNKPPRALTKMVNHIPAHPRDPDISFKFDPGKMIPQEKSYYTYEGSLTTPPCTEGVTWIVMKRKIGFKREQLKKLVSFNGRNARTTQPVYFRKVKATRKF